MLERERWVWLQKVGRGRSVRRLVVALATVAALGTACTLDVEPAHLPAQSTERTLQRTFAATPGLVVELRNLAGAIVLEGADDAENLALEVTVHAAAEDEAAARALSESLQVEIDEAEDRVQITALFPVDRYRRYLYPGDDEGVLRWLGGSRTMTNYLGERVTVSSTPRGETAALWADFRLLLPPGVEVRVENAVGEIDVGRVRGDLTAELLSGDIRSDGGGGRRLLETRSGDVKVTDLDGDVNADTGSGDVVLTEVRGSVVADTGSGDIILERVSAVSVVADTGSGDITLQQVSGVISCDTGSGDVWGDEIRAGGRLMADTGSGDVRFAGDMSEVEQVMVDTGSGSIELVFVSAVPQLSLMIATSAGEIDVDLPDLEVVDRGRRRFQARVGAGTVPAELRTSSGDISVRRGTDR